MANAVLETKILEAMKEHFAELQKQDERVLNKIAENTKKLEAIKSEDPKNYEEHKDYYQKWFIGDFEKMLNHGYGFIKDLKNIISVAMYGKLYEAWEPAHCGYKGRRGTPGYEYSELSDGEKKIVKTVYDRMIDKGYLKPSKSGWKAKLVK